MRKDEPAAAEAAPPYWPALLAVLVGIGLGRFAYTPLLPLLVERGWVSEAGGAFAGASNLAGYLVGALAAQALAANPRRAAILNGAMLAAALSLAACALPLGVAWLSIMRFAAGIAGGLVMVLGPSAILARTPAPAKGRVSGAIFVGVGLGIIVSGALLPSLAALGLSAAWAALGIAGLVLTAAAWRHWPSAPVPAKTASAGVKKAPLALVLIVVAYATDGIGFVPHTLFLSDFVARGLGLGEAAGGLAWALFGIGAVIGAPACGLLATRIGLGPALVAALAAKAVAVAMPLVSVAPFALAASALVTGALTPGMVALAAGLAAQLMDGPAQARLFGTMTIAFALAQAGGAYALSALFAQSGSHLPLFAVGAGVLLAGAILAAAGLALAGRAQRGA